MLYTKKCRVFLKTDGFSLDIPALKKKIKYCKNPLEKRCLEKQLNVDYKELHKRRTI